MKDCCKEGLTKSGKPKFKKWFNYAIYIIIAAIVIGALILQITNDPA
jgi:hypothetical protein